MSSYTVRARSSSSGSSKEKISLCTAPPVHVSHCQKRRKWTPRKNRQLTIRARRPRDRPPTPAPTPALYVREGRVEIRRVDSEVRELEVDEFLDAVAVRARLANLDAAAREVARVRLGRRGPEAAQVRLLGLALLVPLCEALRELDRAPDFDVERVGVCRV